MRAAKFPDRKLTVDEFLVWVETDPDAEFVFDDGNRRSKCDVRFELHEGVVVAMAPERVRHARVKAECWLALHNSIRTRGLGCEAFTDGLVVRIDPSTSYEPDALVRCGDRLDGDSLEITDPIIIVEVLSPSTQSKDLGEKLEAYFRLASVQHYLILDPDRRRAVHHQRQSNSEALLTRIFSAGSIKLDPPGIEIALEDILPPPGLGDAEDSP